jgi:signal transduction histidine kinase
MGRRFAFRHWVAADIACAGLTIVAILALVMADGHHAGTTAQTWMGTSLACLAVAGIAARRCWPLAALTASAGAQTAALIVSPAATQAVLFAVALVIYTVARVKQAFPARAALVGTLGSYFLTVPLIPGPASNAAARALVESIVIAAAWAIGRAARATAAYSERYARATLQAERLRIARELHDVVAHSMGVIAVQAGVGHFVIRDRPDEAEKALSVIEATSRASLAEMRRLLGVLRDEPPADLLPPRGLADLPELVEQTRHAGLEVEVSVAGEPRELPGGADLTAFRLIQEALTNVLKHAGTSRCRAALIYAGDAVTITVTDEGRGGHGVRAGHGLTGMRERVAMYGGTFRAGPLPRRGFCVEARLPL